MADILRELEVDAEQRWMAIMQADLRAIRELLERLVEGRTTELETSLRQTAGILDGTVSAMNKVRVLDRAYRVLGEGP